jgi:succinyl-diaminopimelate desuccinylase
VLVNEAVIDNIQWMEGVSMNEGQKKWIINQIETRSKWFIELLQQLVRIQSPNPPGDTTQIHAFVKNLLDQRGIAYQEYIPHEKNPNLVAVLGSGKSPKLTFNGHYDTFPVEDSSLWTDGPYSGSIRDGKIFGRGVSDMKAGDAAALGVFLMILEEHIKFNGSLVLNLVSEEENGSRWGAWWMAANVPEILGDACLVGEPVGVQTPLIGQKAPLWVKIKTIGEPMHGAYSDGRDAVWQMARAIQEIQTLNDLSYPPPEPIAELVEKLKKQLKMTGAGHDWWMERPSINFGRISGGVKINVVPSSCEIELDIRVPFGTTKEVILKELQSRLDRAGVNASVEVIYGENDSPNFTSWDHPFIQVLRDSICTTTGVMPEPLLMPYMTDERVFRKYGVPTASCGPNEHNMGGTDEFVVIEEFLQTAKVFALTSAEFCKADIPSS